MRVPESADGAEASFAAACSCLRGGAAFLAVLADAGLLAVLGAGAGEPAGVRGARFLGGSFYTTPRTPK